MGGAAQNKTDSGGHSGITDGGEGRAHVVDCTSKEHGWVVATGTCDEQERKKKRSWEGLSGSFWGPFGRTLGWGPALWRGIHGSLEAVSLVPGVTWLLGKGGEREGAPNGRFWHKSCPPLVDLCENRCEYCGYAVTLAQVGQAGGVNMLCRTRGRRCSHRLGYRRCRCWQRQRTARWARPAGSAAAATAAGG